MMNFIKNKTVLVICCFLGFGISFLYHFFYMNSRSFFIAEKLTAPIHLNIEIKNSFASNVSIIKHRRVHEDIEFLPTHSTDQLGNCIIYSELSGFIKGLSLRVKKEAAAETLNAINGISIFIGKKLFYFSHSNILSLHSREQGKYIAYELPGLEYEKSVTASLLGFTGIANYYGDLNSVIQFVILFFSRPDKFIIAWFFFICLLVLLQEKIYQVLIILGKNKNLLETILFTLVLFIGFAFRFNGYVRYSYWWDELCTTVLSGNPGLPFIAAFGDPGNPPFYNILLRIWFGIFGWTEQSGRLFSVILGTAAIIPLYILVKLFAGRKAAFLAAIYASVSSMLIHWSHEVRGYILLVLLVPIVAHYFFQVIKSPELKPLQLALYIIPSVFFVNTHYFGSLLIFTNFLFFVFYSIIMKSFSWKNTAIFFTCNLIIAASLLPWFISTALNGALLNPDFNTWIDKPGTILKLLAAIIPFFSLLYIYIRKKIFKWDSSILQCRLADYTVFVTSALFLIAFGVSLLLRPILHTKYLILLFPLEIAFFAVVFAHILTKGKKPLTALCSIFMFAWMLGGLEPEKEGLEPFHESLTYTEKDAAANPEKVSMEATRISYEITHSSFLQLAKFYGRVHLPIYSIGDNFDILYFNAITQNAKWTPDIVKYLGIDMDKALRINIDRQHSVIKLYSDALTGRDIK